MTRGIPPVGLVEMTQPAEQAARGMVMWAGLADDRHRPGGDAEADRGRRYAAEAVGRICYGLSEMTEGGRNDAAFRAGARLAEFVNADWSGLDGREVSAAYMAACAIADQRGVDRFPAREAEAVLLKAIRHVGKRPAELPPPGHLGEWMTEWGLPAATVDFSGAGTPTGSSDPTGRLLPEQKMLERNPAGGAGGGASGSGATDEFDGPLPVLDAPRAAPAGMADAQPALSRRELQVLAEMERLDVRAEAAGRLKDRNRPRINYSALFMTDAGLAAIPKAEPLIEGWLYKGTLARVFGPSGHGKTFVTLSQAASIATGRPWHGIKTKQAGVVYVIAEGSEGIADRAAAWCEREGVESTGITWLPMPVQLLGGEFEDFISAVVMAGPGLVVFDTQARVTVGVNENDNTEMGEVVAACDRLRAASGACVLLVHHQGANEADLRARGATAVKGAVHTEISVARGRGKAIMVRNGKQKDAAEAADLALFVQAVPGTESIVLLTKQETLLGVDGFSDPVVPERWNKRQMMGATIARILIDLTPGTPGLTRAQVERQFKEGVKLDGGDTRNVARDFAWGWSELERMGRLARNITPGAGRGFRFIEIPGIELLDRNPDRKSDDLGWEIAAPGASTDESPVVEQKVPEKLGAIHGAGLRRKRRASMDDETDYSPE